MFLKENKIFWALIIAAIIIATAIIFVSYYIYRSPASVNTETTNCPNVPNLPNNSIKLATRIIDGDTFIIEGGHSVRILGIDADEKGDKCYQLAKEALEDMILNKEVKLEKGPENTDKYCRYLRYAIIGNKNVSLELVKSGLAIALFYQQNTQYRQEITDAEKQAKQNKIGCEWQGK